MFDVGHPVTYFSNMVGCMGIGHTYKVSCTTDYLPAVPDPVQRDVVWAGDVMEGLVAWELQ